MSVSKSNPTSSSTNVSANANTNSNSSISSVSAYLSSFLSSLPIPSSVSSALSSVNSSHLYFFLGGVSSGLLVNWLINRQSRDLYRTLKEYRFMDYVMVQKKGIEGDPKSVLETIDDYGWKYERAMNLGDAKGRIVEGVVRNQLRVPSNRPVVALELGAYMGYSAVHFTSLLPANSLYISLEINPLYAAISTKMLEFAHTNSEHGASVQSKVVIGTLSSRGEYVRQMIRQFRKKFPGSAASASYTSSEKEDFGDSLDLIFIDHWKPEYVPDFLRLETLGFIGKGTVIMADNIIYPGAPDYLKLLQSEEKRRQYDSQLYESTLEYSNKKDAVLVSVRK